MRGVDQALRIAAARNGDVSKPRNEEGAKIWKIFAPLAIFVVEFIGAQIHCGATATSMKNPPDSGIVIPRTTTF